MEEDFELCILNGEEDEDDDWSKPVDLYESPTGKIRKDPSYQAELLKQSVALHQATQDHPQVIVHIDVDCFYAQVEMIHNPALRDVPLGIQQKYLVVTCNYPARARGVTKLMGITDAKKKCPELVLVSGEDLTRYREMSYKISEFLMKYTPNVERLGFDENFLDVTEMVDQRIRGRQAEADVIGHMYPSQDPVESDSQVSPCSCGCHHRLAVGSQIAADIRSALNIELGITCCAGIAHNKLLAKLVGSQHKPNQQTTVYPGHALSLITGLKSARHIPGIGSATSKRLKALGVETVSDLQQFSKTILEEEFGATLATTIHSLAFGIDPSPVVTYGKPQMLSLEDSFQSCNTEKEAMSRISRLITNLLPRVQEDGRTPHTLRLSVRKANKEKHHYHRESRQCNFPATIAARITSGQLDVAHKHLVSMAMTLLRKVVDFKQPPHLKLINVAFTKLEETTNNNIKAFFTPHTSTLSAPASQDSHEPSDTSVCATSKSPQLDEKSVVNSARKSANSTADSSAGDSPKRRHPGNLASFFTKKQKMNETAYNSTESAGESDRGSDGITESLTARSSGNVTLPAGVDPDVFVQLPEEIQQEILRTAPQPCSDTTKDTAHSSVSQQNTTNREKVAVPGTSECCLRKRCPETEQRTPDKSFFIQTKKAIFSPKKDTVKESSHVQNANGSEKLLSPLRIHEQAHSCSQTDLEMSHVKYVNQKDRCFSEGNNLEFSLSKGSCLSEQSTQIISTSDAKSEFSDSKCQSLPQKLPTCSNTGDTHSSSIPPKKKSLIHSLHNPKLTVPRGIAPDVFSALPADLQREVAAEMAIQKHCSSTSSRNFDIGLKKSQAKSPAKQTNSMWNYLKKR